MSRKFEPITSPGQLESAAAAVEFNMRFSTDPRGIVARGMRSNHLYAFVENEHLDALLRKPADLARIISYVRERGIGSESREEVEDLLAWLDSGATAFGSGWI